MRTLTDVGSQIVASTVKKAYWLFKIDIGNTGEVDYYLGTKARSYDGNDYTANITSFTPPLFSMPDMPNKIIPINKMDIRIAGIDSIELTPDNTAVADGIGQTEADSTTGWSNYGSPDTFESDSSSAYPPSVGSYQFHVVEAGVPHAGFQLEDLSLVAGDEMELTFDCGIITGTLKVVVTGGTDNNITAVEYTNGSYESKTITYTVDETGSSGRIIFSKFDTEAGEFYVDNISLKRKKRAFPSNFEDAAITASLIIRAKNIELVPNNTAISDSRTEADSIEGLAEYNNPETFESDSSSADPPSVGSYQVHVIESGVGNGGFQISNIKTISGKSFVLTFDCKIISGGIRVFVDNGNGVLSRAEEYSNSDYESKTITGTFSATGNSGRVVFYTYPADGEFYIDNVSWITESEEELSWRYIVDQAHSIDRVLLLNCKDWFTKYLEGDYPNTPLVADLFPADIMKDDNYIVPLIFGTVYIPVRLTFNIISATYVDSNTFTTQNDRTSQFSAGRYLVANCGVDGLKVCTVSSSSHAGGTTTIDINETNLTSNLVRVQLDSYLLGPSSPTYTVSELRTPREMNFKSTYDPGDYTFRQSTAIGGDTNTYRMLEVLGNDIDKDGSNDANSTWGLSNKQAYDALVKFSRDDLVGMTSPPDIAEYILEAWGIPSDEIDDDSKDDANTEFSNRSFSLDVGLYYRRSRIDIITELFALSGMVLNYRDTLVFKILTKVSQGTIEDDDILPGSYRTRRAYTQKQKNSGYVTWQTADEPIDLVNKSIIPAKSYFTSPSNITIRGEWCLDSIKAQKAGKLALQRELLKDKIINLTVFSTFLSVEPGDMITINSINYDQELSSYDCLIIKMTIREDLWIDLECIRFYDDLDDWDDLSISGITVYSADTGGMYSPVFQGEGDSVDLAGGNANELSGAVIIGTDGHFKTNIDPATNGGADLGNETFECFTDGGDSRFKIDYTGGADDGDVIIGNYDGGAGIKWDQSEGELTIKGTIDADAGTIGGWDISATKIYKTGIELDSANTRLRVETGSNYVNVSPAGIVGHDNTLGDVFKLLTDGSAPEFSSGVIKECVYEIYTSGIIRTDSDPANNGGLLINTTNLIGYNSNGDARFSVIYDGANQGDVTIGDYSGGTGVEWDQSEGTFNIKGILTTDSGIIADWTIEDGALRSGIEYTPNNTAVSDSRNEENATTGWVVYNSPDTFESAASDSADPAEVGLYHFHIVESSSVYAGFQLTGLSISALSPLLLTFDCIVISGTLRVYIYDGFGTLVTFEDYTNSDYESKTISDIAGAFGGSSGKIIFSNLTGSSGEFYVDNISFKTTKDIIMLNSNNKSISIGDHNYGGAGIQLQSNEGTSRFYVGDGSDAYFKYDGTSVTIGVDSSGGVTVVGGGDIVLTGSDTDPGVIKLEGTSYSVELGVIANGSDAYLVPLDDGVVGLYLGADTFYGTGSAKFEVIRLYTTELIALRSDDSVYMLGGDLNANAARVYCDPDIPSGTPFVQIRIVDDGLSKDKSFYFGIPGLEIPTDNAINFIGSMGDGSDDPTSDAPVDWIEVSISGATRYIPVYN